MSSQDSETLEHLHQLKVQLEQLRVAQRDASLKSRREQTILKRFIATLSQAHIGSHSRIDDKLIELRRELEHNKDISSLVPKFAILERLIGQKAVAMEKQQTSLEEQTRRSGETLQRVSGLPAQIKRDLRSILSYNDKNTLKMTDNAVRLLAIYERAVKIITSNSALTPAEPEANYSPLLLSLGEELQNLITELDFDGEPGEQLFEIRSKLLTDASNSNLLELTLQVLKLVIEATKYERRTSEQFLEQLNGSLSSSMKSHAQNLDQNQIYFEQRQIMSQELNSLVTTGQSNINRLQDIEEAKRAMTPLFAQLASLTERLQHAEAREQALLERMAHNNNQLEALYDVTQDYRRRLDDQSKRMLQDPLTKVYNRTALLDKLEIEYRRWLKNQHPLWVVVLDIDKFKSINHNFGYSAGDKALKIIAKAISSTVAQTDTVARFSGEEFMLIMPEQNEASCQAKVKEIQSKISNLPFKFRDQYITITLSAACTAFSHNDTPDEILDRLHKTIAHTQKLGPNQLAWKP
ncbi:GGDEF domain-containing protein [Vibrio hangzhouensis]|uniref:diguanylate cyclase n=1 Tax=Vibrio hangzhouensis TaxID=462991 RepID=A0A1H5ULV3_9VIBR|nr:GGDEF domain-containing protein [Vibrio hangzhouensis]SEF76059.1 diguanylate cyclase (GGDEF) domain-containing protein [Vibrio hangzhouensis]